VSVVVPDPATTDWVPLWSMGGPGAMVLVEDKLLAADAASIDFQNIPQTYQHLRLVVKARATTAAIIESLYVRVNGDTGSNYDQWYTGHPSGGAAVVDTQLVAQAVGCFLGSMPGASADADRFSASEVLIPDYTGPSKKQMAITHSFTRDAAANHYHGYGGTWRSLSAINRLTLVPLANNLRAGTRATLYALTDTAPAGRPAQAFYGSTPPGSPIDGDEWVLPVDTANGVMWKFRYNALSASAYKWEFVGGSPLISEVATQEATGSTTDVALTTAGPSIVIPRAGEYVVELGCKTSGGSASTAVMSYDIGATPAADADSLAVPHNVGDFAHGSRPRIKALAAVTLVAKYKAGAGSDSFSDRWFRVTPVRVS
jgi:hypothetical protein